MLFLLNTWFTAKTSLTEHFLYALTGHAHDHLILSAEKRNNATWGKFFILEHTVYTFSLSRVVSFFPLRPRNLSLGESIRRLSAQTSTTEKVRVLEHGDVRFSRVLLHLRNIEAREVAYGAKMAISPTEANGSRRVEIENYLVLDFTGQGGQG